MQYFNIIDGLEASDYSWSKVAPRRVVGVPTGETETLHFTGATAALKSMAEQFLAEASEKKQVRCEVVRSEADMAKLTVTRTFYYITGGGGEEGEDSGESGEPPREMAGNVGSSESNPIITWEYAEVQQPILTHPLIRKMQLNEKSPQSIALQMLSKGADMEQRFVYSLLGGGEGVVISVADALAAVPGDVVKLVQQQQFYLDVRLTAHLKYEIDADSKVPDFGMVPRIEKPPGAPKLGQDRNWLFCGGSITQEGDRIMVTKSYKASEVGGWSEECYKG